jgi:Mrp family chromosome partitioning ATPase
MPWELEEGYRKIASILASAVREKRFREVLIASATRGEGSTTITLETARELKARYGLRPLVIELDFRRPVLLKRFGLSPRHTLYAVAEGLMEPAKAIQSNSDGVAMLAAGEKGQAPSQDLAPVLTRAIDETREEVDVVLLEQSSMLTVASIVPRMILVVQAGKTTTDLLDQAKAELAHWNVTLIGAILNKRRRFMPGWLERALR